jgi:hypothetical protein
MVVLVELLQTAQTYRPEVTQFFLALQLLVGVLEETTALVLYQELLIKMEALAVLGLERVAVVVAEQDPLEHLVITTLGL